MHDQLNLFSHLKLTFVFSFNLIYSESYSLLLHSLMFFELLKLLMFLIFLLFLLVFMVGLFSHITFSLFLSLFILFTIAIFYFLFMVFSLQFLAFSSIDSSLEDFFIYFFDVIEN